MTEMSMTKSCDVMNILQCHTVMKICKKAFIIQCQIGIFYMCNEVIVTSLYKMKKFILLDEGFSTFLDYRWRIS
jgi:hypothetical protein